VTQSITTVRVEIVAPTGPASLAFPLKPEPVQALGVLSIFSHRKVIFDNDFLLPIPEKEIARGRPKIAIKKTQSVR
jgi:hypothetical protein